MFTNIKTGYEYHNLPLYFWNNKIKVIVYSQFSRWETHCMACIRHMQWLKY